MHEPEDITSQTSHIEARNLEVVFILSSSTSVKLDFFKQPIAVVISPIARRYDFVYVCVNFQKIPARCRLFSLEREGYLVFYSDKSFLQLRNHQVHVQRRQNNTHEWVNDKLEGLY